MECILISYFRRCGYLAGILYLVNFLFLQSANAQGRFTASAPKSIPENQNFNLTYTLENANGGNLRLPPLNDFSLIGGPSTSTSMQIINGSVSQSSSYTYILRPKKQGVFKIPPATIEISGNPVESNDLTIQVTAPSSQSQAQGNQQSRQSQEATSDAELVKQLKEEVFVKVILSRSSVYKGEFLSATYKLYFRQNLNGFNLVKSPSMEGFWSDEIELDPNRKQKVENYKGKQYYTLDILRYNLYPQRAGTLEIAPAEISTVAQVTVRSKSRDPFNDFFNDPFADFFGQAKNVPLTLKTDIASVTVKELPENGKTKDFAGAVGKFSFETSLSAEESKTDDPVTYTVKISGTGNLNLIEVPSLKLPAGFEVYDPKVKEKITNTEGGISGSKQYDYLIIPRMPGEYKIGGQTFSYFDPASEKYVTINTSEFPLRITGEPSKNFTPGSSSYTAQQNVSVLGDDIHYIKTSVPAFDRNKISFFGSGAFIALSVFPFLAFLGLVALRKRHKQLAADIVGARRRRALRLAKKRLHAADKYLAHSDRKKFYDEISRALWGYMSDKLNIDTAELSKESVAGKLLLRGVRQETIDRLQQLIHSCELSLYAPAETSAEMKGDYSVALNLIADMEDEISITTRLPVPEKALSFLILICLGSLLATAKSPADIYQSGSRHYKEKNYRNAADDFEKLIAEGYRNPEVYYNLGNSYFKLDSISKSIISYERALQLSPGDEDAIHNLKLARLKAADDIQPVPQLAIIAGWNNFITSKTPDGWSVITIIALWLTFITTSAVLFSRKRKWLITLSILFILISISSFGLTVHRQKQIHQSSVAIVTGKSSFVKSAPDLGASNLFVIHEGARIQILDKVGSWNKIRLEDGKVGWLEKNRFEKI